MATANPFAVAKHLEKRDALVAQLDRIVQMCGLNPQHDAHLVVGVIRGWSEARWAELAVSCGKNPPSEITRGMVVDALLARGRRSA